MRGLVLTFPNNTTVNVDYVVSSLVINENYFKSLEPVDNNCRLKAVFSIDLSNKLKQYADEDVVANVYDDDEQLVFAGYLRKTFTFQKTQKNQPIDIEIVSPSYLLDKELSEEVFYTNESVGTIINALGSKIGFTLGCTVSTKVVFFRAKKGDNIRTTIKQLLFEYGYTYDFSLDGSFVTYSLFNLPTENNISHEFTGSDCLTQIQIQRTEKQYTGVTASWSKKEFVENVLLYEDTQGATTSSACSIEIAPKSYMYGDNNDNGRNYLQYDSTKGEVLFATSISSSLQGTYIDQLQTSYENCGDSVLWSAYNPSEILTATYHKFQWYGNAWIITSTNESKTTVTGNKSLSIELSYLNDGISVSSFIAKVADYYRYSLFNVTIKSKTNVSIGSFVTVEDYGIGKVMGRVLTKQTSYIGVYTYTIESVSEYVPSSLDSEKNTIIKNPSDGSADNIAQIKSLTDTLDEKINSVYANHIVTLYKDSAIVLSETGITSVGVYDFSQNTFTFTTESGSNGWSSTKPSTVNHILYTTTATAYGQNVRDTINADEWSSPIPIGQNGVSSRTFQLFIRSDARPEDLPHVFTQNFFDADIDATETQLNGWSSAYPSVTEESLPVWEIHCSVTSVESSIIIQPSMWSVPNKIGQDVEVTQSEIQDMINKAQKLSAPVVYAEKTFDSIMVDEDNVALCNQTISSTIHVLQTDAELDFTFGEVTVPNGFTVTHNRNVLLITIAEGTVVSAGSLNVPIIYYPYIAMDKYGDEDGNVYVDDSGDEYGFFITSDTPTTYNLGFSYQQTKSGRYLKSISNINSIPTTLFVGDFFTWNGSNTETSICEDGSFVTGSVYKYTGNIWKKDTSASHLQTALSDVLTNANIDLQNNNSEIYAMFQKILANEAILNNLIVTGSALINRLNALDIYADKITVAKTDAIDNSLEQMFGEDGVDKTTHTIIEGSKIETGLINAEEIRSGLVKTTTLESDYITAEEIESDYAKITTLESDYAKITTLESDYVKTTTLETDYLSATEIESDYVKTTKLESDYITANEIESDYAKITTLETDYLKADEIESDYVKTTTLESDYASIDYLEGGDASFNGSVTASNFALKYESGDVLLTTLKTISQKKSGFFVSCGLGSMKLSFTFTSPQFTSYDSALVTPFCMMKITKNDEIIIDESVSLTWSEKKYEDYILTDLNEEDVINIYIYANRTYNSITLDTDIKVKNINYLTKALIDLTSKSITQQ